MRRSCSASHNLFLRGSKQSSKYFKMSSDSSEDSSLESSIDSSEDSSQDSSSSSDSDKSFMCPLPFEPKSIEKIILTISDHFNFRVIIGDQRTKKALLVTTGLTLAGGLLGQHYGGKIGAAVGGAVGGACGVGLVIVSMRSVWDEIKEKLSGLIEIVYDYLAGLGLEDYKRAATFLAKNGSNKDLAKLILKTASGLLGKQILSSLITA